MPDYAACTNEQCPVRTECARFMMVWSDYQAVGSFPHEGETHNDCFWPVSDAPFNCRTEVNNPPFELSDVEDEHL